MMGTFYNIRGTNGSGKTTLARCWTRPSAPVIVTLAYCDAPTKKEPGRRLPVLGHGDDLHVGLVGPYLTPTGGMDNVPSFEAARCAVEDALDRRDHVIGEGVLASTVFGSWAVFNDHLPCLGHEMAWCYLDTPLEVCLARIKQRQRAAGRERPIKEDQVADKVRAIAATRRRALEAGYRVHDIPFEIAEKAMKDIMVDRGAYRAK